MSRGSHTGNPYKLPTRVGFWRRTLELAARDDGFSTPEDDADLIAETPHQLDYRSAEDVAAVVWEMMNARQRCFTDATRVANEAAEKWLMMLDQMVDNKRLPAKTRDDHRRMWRDREVTA